MLQKFQFPAKLAPLCQLERFVLHREVSVCLHKSMWHNTVAIRMSCAVLEYSCEGTTALLKVPSRHKDDEVE